MNAQARYCDSCNGTVDESAGFVIIKIGLTKHQGPAAGAALDLHPGGPFDVYAGLLVCAVCIQTQAVNIDLADLVRTTERGRNVSPPEAT